MYPGFPDFGIALLSVELISYLIPKDYEKYSKGITTSSESVELVELVLLRVLFKSPQSCVGISKVGEYAFV